MGTPSLRRPRVLSCERSRLRFLRLSFSSSRFSGLLLLRERSGFEPCNKGKGWVLFVQRWDGAVAHTFGHT